jgi:uncharacterized protein YggE
MRNGRTAAAFAMAAIMGLGLATSAAAQESALPAQEPIEVTAELLERFVAVYPAVLEIATSAQAELQAAETAERAQEIEAAAQQRIVQALTEAEVTLREYEAVVTRLNEDEDLRAEFERLLEEFLEEQGSNG